jgi:hypothetical protein
MGEPLLAAIERHSDFPHQNRHRQLSLTRPRFLSSNSIQSISASYKSSMPQSLRLVPSLIARIHLRNRAGDTGILEGAHLYVNPPTYREYM